MTLYYCDRNNSRKNNDFCHLEWIKDKEVYMKKDKLLTKWYMVLGLATICCVLWGSAFPVVKISYARLSIESSDWATQILYAGMRFTLAGILVIIIGSLLSKKLLYPTFKQMGHVAVLSVFQTILQYLCFYIGLAHTLGSKAAIIVGTNVFVAILVSGLIFKLEKVTMRKIIGCLLGFAGILLINVSADFTFTFSPLGEGLIFLSTFAYAFSSVIMKRFTKEDDAVMLSGYQFLLGGIVMVVVGFLFGGRVHISDIGDVLILLYLAALSAVAYTLWGILLKYNPVSKVAVYGFINPIAGVLLSTILLHEDGFGIKAFVALVLVCAGIAVVNITVRKRRSEEKQETKDL